METIHPPGEARFFMDEKGTRRQKDEHFLKSVLRGKYRLLMRSAMVNMDNDTKREKGSTLTENSYKKTLFSGKSTACTFMQYILNFGKNILFE